MDADTPDVTSHRGPQSFVTPALAVDVAALTVLPKVAPGGLRRLGVVVVKPDGKDGWRLPGAFVHAPARWAAPERGPQPSPADEVPPLRAAVNRALGKAGLEGRVPQQLHVFDAPDRDERGWVISVAHLDTLPRREVPGAGVEIGAGNGHRVAVAVVRGKDGDVEALLEGVPLRLPYDHAHVLRVAVADLRARYAANPDPGHLLGDRFTVRELRRVHEAVAEEQLLKDSFRRHMDHGIVGTGEEAAGYVGRPPELYRRRTVGDGKVEPKVPRPLRTAAAQAAKRARQS